MGPRTTERGTEGAEATRQRAGEDVFAEDWWTHARPVFEIHGYFRVRGELFHNFSLGRHDDPNGAMWPQPADNAYSTLATDQQNGPTLCTPDEAGTGNSDDPSQRLVRCRNKSQAGANLRFRLNPELHVSDNVRVLSEVDLLDNVVLGSTPEGLAYQPSGGRGYEVVRRSGYQPVGVLDDTIVPPNSGTNSLRDSIQVKRAWGEYSTPVGELRFGRMPDHWGLGMLHNAGDGYDDDYQSTIDRIMFMTGIKPLDLYLGGAWDFVNEGVISNTVGSGQAYDRAQLDDVDQWALILMHKKSPELVKLALSQGDLVLNGGAYVILRKQLLANDQNGGTATATAGANVPDADPTQQANGFTRRGATIWVPDLWLQLRYRKFRFEAEFASVLGSIESIQTASGTADYSSDSPLRRDLRQFGLATELEQKLVEDRLKLDFHFGWASGDPDAFDPSVVGNLVPGPQETQINDNTDSTFRFHPNYRIDLILHRNILSRVQGTYYFRPGVEYDFMRKPSGQRFGGGAAVIWSRASEFVQTPGHARDLGIELDGKLYFQSKDGSLNDEPGEMGGFYSALEYGVFFPLGGLGYQNAEEKNFGSAADTSAAQILRLYLGILF